jgi:ribosomal-protein-alanine N-acetyltransferase
MEIKLRPWHINDLNTLVKIANNPNIAKYMADVFPYPYTEEKGITFINFTKENKGVSIFAITLNNIPIGSIGLHLQSDILRKNAEIGYWLSEEYWKKGITLTAINEIVKYGFNNLDIVRIFARVFGNNTPSQKLITKAGFTLEAKFEKTIYKNGEYLDELIYAIRK